MIVNDDDTNDVTMRHDGGRYQVTYLGATADQIKPVTTPSPHCWVAWRLGGSAQAHLCGHCRNVYKDA